MTTYNTGNPIGSTDARDLYDNAQNLDKFANGTAASYTDRLGVSRRSLAGIDSAADNVLNSIGYAVPVAYASGISLTLTSQTVEYNGVVYAPLSSALPFTTSSWGTDSAKFRAVQVTDADLITYTPAGTGAVATTVQSKLLETVSVKDFGAVGDGVTDDTAAIQAAFTYAATFEHARVQFAPGTRCKCTSGLTIDVSRVGIDGNGAMLDFSSVTSVTALSFTQSNADANIRTLYNHVNSIDNLLFNGPGANQANAVAVAFNDAALPNTLAGGSFNHCGFLNWGIDVAHQNGAFCWTFNKCAFTVTSGTPTTYSITFPTLTNNGERNMFIDCFWYNRRNVMDCSNGNSSTMFIGCSVDGAGRAFTITAGHVYVVGCHIEYVDDTDYWFYVSGENTSLTLESCEIVSQSAKTSYSPFYSDSTAEMGGVSIKNCAYGSTSSMTVPLIGGTGRAVVENLKTQKSGTKPTIIAESANALAYGGFESANYTAEWALASGAIRSNAQARTGTYSLGFPGSAGVTPSGSISIPCKPGQYVYGELWYKVTGITGTSGTFYCTINWLDKGGNALASAAPLIQTTDVSAWARLPLNFLTPAPKGTTAFSVSFSLFGTASGAPTGYIDDVTVCVV